MGKSLVRFLLAVLTAAAIGTAYAQGSEDAVTEETRRVFDAYAENHDPTYYAADATFTDMSRPTQPIVGPEAIGAFLATFYGGAFSNAVPTEVAKLVDGNLVMLEFEFSGDHTGDLFGIPATGKHVEMSMMSVYGVEEGKIQWARLYYDSASLMRQLGMIE